MAELTMAGALNAALRDAMRGDARTIVLGEDVGRLGGVFRVTDGLLSEFGGERVIDTPLAEGGIAGVSIGLALAGWHPVAEMQFDAFSYPALDQLISHAAHYRFRTRGRMTVPLVVRIPYGGAIHAAESHSDSPEAYYAHTAGLKVVVPSSPADAYGLLRAAVADPDPVIFLEPKSRYWTRGEVEPGAGAEPIGRATIVRPGQDCTVVAYGAMIARALGAAEAAAKEGISVEVLDLRSLVPLDLEALAASVRRTGHAVVVHEAQMTGGFGAEIVARLVEDAFDYLEAPVARVTGYDTPYPPSSLEDHWLPSADRILAAVERVVAY